MKDGTILLVEDNADDEALTIRALRKNNILNEVRVARDGEEALDYLIAAPPGPLPTLILLDLKLPKIDGFEVLRRVRADERTKLIPTVVLTSSKEEQDNIVSILNKFETLIRDLSGALPAEFNARRQQYEHYRDQLLTFAELAA